MNMAVIKFITLLSSLALYSVSSLALDKANTQFIPTNFEDGTGTVGPSINPISVPLNDPTPKPTPEPTLPPKPTPQPTLPPKPTPLATPTLVPTLPAPTPEPTLPPESETTTTSEESNYIWANIDIISTFAEKEAPYDIYMEVENDNGEMEPKLLFGKGEVIDKGYIDALKSTKATILVKEDNLMDYLASHDEYYKDDSQEETSKEVSESENETEAETYDGYIVGNSNFLESLSDVEIKFDIYEVIKDENGNTSYQLVYAKGTKLNSEEIEKLNKDSVALVIKQDEIIPYLTALEEFTKNTNEVNQSIDDVLANIINDAIDSGQIILYTGGSDQAGGLVRGFSENISTACSAYGLLVAANNVSFLKSTGNAERTALEFEVINLDAKLLAEDSKEKIASGKESSSFQTNVFDFNEMMYRRLERLSASRILQHKENEAMYKLAGMVGLREKNSFCTSTQSNTETSSASSSEQTANTAEVCTEEMSNRKACGAEVARLAALAIRLEQRGAVKLQKLVVKYQERKALVNNIKTAFKKDTDIGSAGSSMTQREDKEIIIDTEQIGKDRKKSNDEKADELDKIEYTFGCIDKQSKYDENCECKQRKDCFSLDDFAEWKKSNGKYILEKKIFSNGINSKDLVDGLSTIDTSMTSEGVDADHMKNVGKLIEKSNEDFSLNTQDGFKKVQVATDSELQGFVADFYTVDEIVKTNTFDYKKNLKIQKLGLDAECFSGRGGNSWKMQDSIECR